MTPEKSPLIDRLPWVLRRRAVRARDLLVIATHPRDEAKHCCICGSRVGRFLPYRDGSQAVSPYLRELEYVTGDLDNHTCPVCWNGDRVRHLVLYFDALGLWELVRGARVLHVAPERGLRDRFRTLAPARYVMADLEPRDADSIAMDITDIAEPDDAFDLVVCNHVLEHVSDLDAALAEIRRVLMRDGTAVLQTPFAAGLSETREDPDISSDADRIYYYGQEDHTRLFGQDLFARMRQAGLNVHYLLHEDVLPHVDAAREGVSADEGLILVRPLGD